MVVNYSLPTVGTVITNLVNAVISLGPHMFVLFSGLTADGLITTLGASCHDKLFRLIGAQMVKVCRPR